MSGATSVRGAGSRLRIASKMTADVSPVNGSDAGRHLIEHGAERKQVGARVGELPARLLGRHVAHRAHRRAGRREVLRRARLRLRSLV